MSTSSSFQRHYALGPPFTGIDLEWWDQLEDHPTARTLRISAIASVQAALATTASARRLTVQSIINIHRTVFGGLFPELAGRVRGPHPAIPANVTFGFRRGVPYERVSQSLDHLDNYLNRLLDQLDGLSSDTNVSRSHWRRQVLEAGAIVHCEVIRIHPFVNGNGRTARLCINYFTSRYGYPPIPIERPRDRYVAAVDAWIATSDIAPMTDLLEELATESDV